jgi:putative ABC transport system permease protein
MLWQDMSQRNGPAQEWMSPANYFEWRARATSLEELAVYQQAPSSLTGVGEPEQLAAWRQAPRRGGTLVVRTSGDPALVAPALRAAVSAADPALPVGSVATLESLVAGSLAIPRLMTMLTIAFAAAALLLAAMGVYGLIAFSVSQRTREFGLRAALGADRRRVMALVMGQTATLVGIAVLVGTGAAFGAARLIAALLFGVRPGDVLTFVVTALVLVLVALAAGYAPARRATRVNPIEALREL